MLTPPHSSNSTLYTLSSLKGFVIAIGNRLRWGRMCENVLESQKHRYLGLRVWLEQREQGGAQLERKLEIRQVRPCQD